MISCIYILSIYGEPYSSSGYIGVTGYTGRYLVWFLVSILVCYYLWVGVQLPQGKYVSYGRGYLVVSVWCNIGYSHRQGDPLQVYQYLADSITVVPVPHCSPCLVLDIYWYYPLYRDVPARGGCTYRYRLYTGKSTIDVLTPTCTCTPAPTLPGNTY